MTLRSHSRRLVGALVCVALLAAASLAAADEDERRLSVSGAAAAVVVDAFGTAGTTEAYGGGVSLAFGLRNWLDLGVDVDYLARPNSVLADAVLDGAGGDGFSLYTDLHAVAAAMHARVILDGIVSYRVRPVLGARVGATARVLARPDLFDADGIYVGSGDTELGVAPFVGGEAGIGWRFTERWQLALLATGTMSTAGRSVGATLELSRFSYDLL